MQDRNTYNFRLRQRAIILMFLVVVSAVLSSASPPFAMNDELYHWLRVLQFSRGTLLADKLGDDYWGGQVDKKAYEFSLWIFDKIQKKQPIPSAEAWVTAQTWGDLKKETTVQAHPYAMYTPLAYLPQTFGVAVAQRFTSNFITHVIAGRFANCVVYLCLVIAIFEILPFGRAFFLNVALIPSALFNSAGLGTDPLNFTLPGLLIAFCLRLRNDPNFPFGLGMRISVAGLSLSLGLLKPVSLAIAPVVLLIPAARFSSRSSHLAFVASCLAVAFIVAVLWYTASPLDASVKFWNSGAKPQETIARMLADPAQAAKTFVRSIASYQLVWWDGYGRFGGHAAPYSFYTPLYLDTWAFFLLVALAAVDGNGKTDIRQAVLFPLLAAGYFLLVVFAIWIGFSPTGSPDIFGISGRYFYLIYLLMGLALAGSLAAPMALLDPLRSWIRSLVFWILLALNGYVTWLALDELNRLWAA